MLCDAAGFGGLVVRLACCDWCCKWCCCVIGTVLCCQALARTPRLHHTTDPFGSPSHLHACTPASQPLSRSATSHRACIHHPSPPQVFSDSATFSEWFTKFLGVDSFGDGGGGEAAALDREKKVLVVNRLHQILSPFMLRRMVRARSTH